MKDQILEQVAEVRGEQSKLWEATELVANAVKDVRSSVEAGFAAVSVNLVALQSGLKHEVSGLLNEIKDGNLASIQAASGLHSILAEAKSTAEMQPQSSAEAADLIRVVTAALAECAAELQADFKSSVRAQAAGAGAASEVASVMADGQQSVSVSDLVLELEKHRALLLHDLKEGRADDRFLFILCADFF